MQYWIIFLAGVGGDGFSNLIEHSCNVLPADGVLEWREHYRVDGRIKFYSCDWAQPDPKPFRQPGIRNAVLNSHYVDCVYTQQNTVIPAHYWYWDDYKQFEHQPIINKNQYKIHLYSSNPERAFQDAFIKNQLTIKPELYQGYCYNIKKELERPDYQCHIDIEQVWSSWSYLEEKLKTAGIEIQRQTYDQYMELINA
jgi:hypothetical protein